MMNKFQQLSARERRLLIIGGGILLLLLLWLFVYRPTENYLTTQAELKTRLSQQLTVMQRETQDIKPERLQPVQALPPDMTFSAWLDRQLVDLKLQQLVKRSEPIDSNTVTLWMQQVPFDAVADWLQNINGQYGIEVDQADINVTDRSLGLVTIRMRLIKP